MRTCLIAPTITRGLAYARKHGIPIRDVFTARSTSSWAGLRTRHLVLLDVVDWPNPGRVLGVVSHTLRHNTGSTVETAVTPEA